MDNIIDSGKHSTERWIAIKRENVLGQKGLESNGAGCSSLLFLVKALRGEKLTHKGWKVEWRHDKKLGDRSRTSEHSIFKQHMHRPRLFMNLALADESCIHAHCTINGRVTMNDRMTHVSMHVPQNTVMHKMILRARLSNTLWCNILANITYLLSTQSSKIFSFLSTLTKQVIINIKI